MSAGLTMLAIFVMRFNFVMNGQMFSLKPVLGHDGARLIYQPAVQGERRGLPRLHPSIVESLIVLGAMAAAVLLYVGGQNLRVHREARHE